MPLVGTISVRHPYVGEVPPELIEGFVAWKIDPEWQWVAVHDGRVVAQLLTAPMHGVLYLMRMTAVKDAPRGWMVPLLRQVLREARDRGLIGYLVLLTDANEGERKMMRIVQRHGAYFEPVTGVLAAGRLENTY